MLRKTSTFYALLLAAMLVANTSSAALLLEATPVGSNVVLINHTIDIVISLTVTQLPYVDGMGVPHNVMRWSGTDFQLFTNSDSTFEDRSDTVPAANNSGGWLSEPTPGNDWANWSNFVLDGGNGNPYIQWNEVGQGADIATIILRGGPTPGIFEATWDNVLHLNNTFGEIPNNRIAFTYQVIPEPSAALLVGVALSGLAFRRRRSAPAPVGDGLGFPSSIKNFNRN